MGRRHKLRGCDRHLDGNLSDLPVAHLIALCRDKRVSGSLEVRSWGRVGRVHFRAGDIVDAAFGALAGERAVAEMSSLRDGMFSLSQHLPTLDLTGGQRDVITSDLCHAPLDWIVGQCREHALSCVIALPRDDGAIELTYRAGQLARVSRSGHPDDRPSGTLRRRAPRSCLPERPDRTSGTLRHRAPHSCLPERPDRQDALWAEAMAARSGPVEVRALPLHLHESPVAAAPPPVPGHPPRRTQRRAAPPPIPRTRHSAAQGVQAPFPAAPAAWAHTIRPGMAPRGVVPGPTAPILIAPTIVPRKHGTQPGERRTPASPPPVFHRAPLAPPGWTDPTWVHRARSSSWDYATVNPPTSRRIPAINAAVGLGLLCLTLLVGVMASAL